jgi:hypothetical protein
VSAAPTRPDDGFDPAERIERQSRALEALAEAGVELTRALVDEVVSGREGAFRGVDPALAYSRIGRAVRLAIALEHRLREEPAQALAAPAVRADEADDGDAAAAVESEPAEGREHPESERPDSERLREDLSDDALLARPRAEIYALICRDLGHVPEPGLFEPCNDDAAAPEAPPAPARRLACVARRAALLTSAGAGPMAGPGPAFRPFPRPPP